MTTLKETKNQKTTLNKEEKTMINLKAKEREAFKNVIGYDSIKSELMVISDMFLNKEAYDEIGARLPHGIMIAGEPGLGKTLLSNCFIKGCGCTSFLIKNDCLNDDLIKNITNVFEEAKKTADSGESCIIFFDDLDKFAEGTRNDDKKIFVNIQSLIDGVNDKRILILATVNNILKLPKSLTREGRFDKIFTLRTPSSEDAMKIIKYYLTEKKVSSSLNYEDVSKMVSYHSCAMLETLINNSAIRAKYNRRKEIIMEDIVLTYIGKELSLAKDNEDENNESIIEDDKDMENKKVLALHEAGHIVVSEILVPNSVGFAHLFNCFEGYTSLCKDLGRRPFLVLGALAGKAACELFDKGRPASGCDSDLNRAYNLIMEGISSNATHGYQSLYDKFSEGRPSDISLFINESIVRAELQRNDYLVKDILMKNKDFLFKIRDLLLKKGYICYSDIQKIKKETKITSYEIY